MVRRYLIPCVVIVVAALAASMLAYKGAYKKRFSATCTYQVLLSHPGSQQALTVDAIDANNRVAGAQVALALGSGVYAEVAGQTGVAAAGLAANLFTTAPAGLGVFQTRLIDNDPSRVVTLVDAICDQIVTTIEKQRSDLVSGQISDAKERMDTVQAQAAPLEKIPVQKRTLTQQAQLHAQLQALNGLASLVASLLSQPPDTIRVLKPASSGLRYDPRSLKKNLILGLVAGVLVCFLYIIVAEMMLERRRRMSTPERA